MEIEINIDDNCKICKEALKYFNKLYKRNKNAYMSFIIKPLPKSDKEFVESKIRGLTLTPDYNASGYLTHFHLNIEKEGGKW